MKQIFLVIILTIQMIQSNAQDKLPYDKIPDAPESYTAGSVVSRMIDGLGFRYYWATYGLRTEDLQYRPSKMARTSEETLDHILSLSQVVLNSALGVPNTASLPEMTFEEKRKRTLLNLQQASAIFIKVEDLSKFTIVFGSGDKKIEFPFWNQINGPISDALWHVGQIVSYRRASGNPFPKGVSVLRGTRTE